MKIISKKEKITYNSSNDEIIRFAKEHLNKEVKGEYNGDFFTGILSGYCIKSFTDESLSKTIAISNIKGDMLYENGWTPDKEDNVTILNYARRIYLITNVELI